MGGGIGLWILAFFKLGSRLFLDIGKYQIFDFREKISSDPMFHKICNIFLFAFFIILQQTFGHNGIDGVDGIDGRSSVVNMIALRLMLRISVN